MPDRMDEVVALLAKIAATLDRIAAHLPQQPQPAASEIASRISALRGRKDDCLARYDSLCRKVADQVETFLAPYLLRLPVADRRRVGNVGLRVAYTLLPKSGIYNHSSGSALLKQHELVVASFDPKAFDWGAFARKCSGEKKQQVLGHLVAMIAADKSASS